jgi:acetolactate synthase-1/2/3 large subunit
VKIAEGYSIQSRRVTERKDLEAAMKEMVESKNSYFLEVVVEMEENVFPMIPSGASVSDIRLK